MNKSQITISFELTENGKMTVTCAVNKGGNEQLDSLSEFVAVNLPFAINATVKQYLQHQHEEKSNAVH